MATVAASGTFAESPQNVGIPGGFPLPLHGQQMAQGELEPERNYHINLAFQRDIGFNTVAEVAYVSNIGRKYLAPEDDQQHPASMPTAIRTTCSTTRRSTRTSCAATSRASAEVRYLATDDDILNYNAMQLSVQRRLTKGLQMGMAYTLSKSEGMQGWDFMTEELGGKEGLRDRYYGPPAGNPTGVQDGRQDRRHVVVVNYSYMIPGALQNVSVLKHVLRDWEASGVSTFMTGSNVNPTCNTNLTGIANEDPTLTGAPVRCELVPGQDIDEIRRGGRYEPRTTRSVRTSTWPRSDARCRMAHGQQRQLGAGSAPSPGLAELGLHAGASHSGQHRPGRQRPRPGTVLQRVRPDAVPASRLDLHVRGPIR